MHPSKFTISGSRPWSARSLLSAPSNPFCAPLFVELFAHFPILVDTTTWRLLHPGTFYPLHQLNLERRSTAAITNREQAQSPPELRDIIHCSRCGDRQARHFLVATMPLYSPLGSNQIRLARFASNQHHLKLQEVSLGSCPPYIALSYTWGSRRDCTTINIRCDSPLGLRCGSMSCDFGVHRLSVPRNLEKALRRLLQLYKDEDLAFWADSICIDQFNRVERNHQVPLMRQVYSGAGEVVVFLGEALHPRFANECYLSTGRIRK